MKTRHTLWLAAGLLLTPLPTWAKTPTEPGPRHLRAKPALTESAEEARVIVKYRADGPLRRIQSSATGEGAASARPVPLHAQRLGERLRVPLRDGRVLGPHTQALRGLGLSSSELVRRLSRDPEVEWAVVDQRRYVYNVPNDPLLADNQRNTTPVSGQWYLRAPAGEAVSAINAVGAWTITTGSPNVTVAVLDTGVRPDHPDLQGKLHPGYDFVGLDRGDGTNTANDGDGRDPDPSDPGDWNDLETANCPAGSSSWHGTQVAGLIAAATNNGVGMAGAGWQTMVLPIRVLGRCGGYDSDIIAGMRWAAGVTQNVGLNTVVNVRNPHPARILNMSLGSIGPCERSYQDTMDELTAAGVTVIVAAGNDTGLAVGTPANCRGAIGVAGIRHVGSKVGFSNIGPEVALAAPGGNCVNVGANEPCLFPLLTTTNLGNRRPTENGYSNSFDFTVGTSFASPLVAGAAALMLAVDPTLTPARIREILQATVRPFPKTRVMRAGEDPVPECRAPDQVDQLECFCTTSTCGAGMLDAFAAVARTRALLPPPPPTPTPTPPADPVTPGGGDSGGGSGGGQSGVGWLLGLLLGVGALAGLNRRRRA